MNELFSSISFTKMFTAFAAAVSFSALMSTAQADHNSIWGEGWAPIPNEVHNTRIDTLDDDNDEFLDFVSSTSGSGSMRPDDTTLASASGGGSDTAGSMGGMQSGRE